MEFRRRAGADPHRRASPEHEPLRRCALCHSSAHARQHGDPRRHCWQGRPGPDSLMALFGIGRQKPHHYLEMARVAWENRDQLPFTWRILKDGVCDGCALGTSGLSDWTIPGIHLCMVRLELMRLNTAPALDPSVLSNIAPLAQKSSEELRALGRLPQPSMSRK